MGLINDLATLMKGGANWDDIKAIAELEKGGKPTEEPPVEPKEPTEEPPLEPKEPAGEPPVEPSEIEKRLEETESKLDAANKKIEELQASNRKKNLDDGSTKSDEDLLNDIMMEMF